MANCRTQLKIQSHESGTVQEDTDFTQAVDKWIEVEEEREHAKEVARLPKTRSAQEAQEAEIHRTNLLRSAHLKRHILSESSDGGTGDSSINLKRIRGGSREDEGEGVAPGEAGLHAAETTVDTVHRISALRKKTKERVVWKDTHEMIEAVKGMGDAVALVAEKLSGREENPSRFLEMEQRLDMIEGHICEEGDLRQKQAEKVEKQQEKTNQLLEGILSKMSSN